MKFKVIVKTKSKRSEITEYDKDTNTYKISLKAKPIEGEANKELLRFLRKEFNAQHRIVSGFRSKEKLIEVL